MTSPPYCAKCRVVPGSVHSVRDAHVLPMIARMQPALSEHGTDVVFSDRVQLYSHQLSRRQ